MSSKPIPNDARKAAPILTSEEARAWTASQQADGLLIGFTCGSFDILHAGHVDYLREARTHCDRLIVAVNSDESVRAYKNPLRPIIGQEHRLALVAALACVDAVVLMEETRPAQLLQLIRPDLYIKGGDYNSGSLRSSSLVESYGGRVLIIAVKHQISTTGIIARIQELSSYAEATEVPRTAQHPKLVFLDRDGTLIENVPFLRDARQVKLLPGVAEGLKVLQDSGYLLVIVTNQQGIGLGYFDYQDFVAVNSEMLKQLSPHQIRISRFYFCPHSHADGCSCRKPGSEMIVRGMDYFGARPEDCFLIGDSTIDMQAAEGAGCQGILVHGAAAGNVREAEDFQSAVRIILEQ